MDNRDILKKIRSVSSWYHCVEVAPGIFTPGKRDCAGLLKQLELPSDLTGLRALDVGGGRDGFFAFEMEKRKASEVVIVDHCPPETTGFPVLKEIFGSSVQYKHDNVYNLSPAKYGVFDVVLCLGLLYHLRHPLLALERIRDVCRGDLYVESFCVDNHFLLPGGSSISLKSVFGDAGPVAIMQFYPTHELYGDYTNWWGPSSTCLAQMLEATNFTVLWCKVIGDRCILKCRANQDPTVALFRTLESGVVP